MHNHVALWAGVSAFFSSLLAIGVIDWLKPDNYIQVAGSLFISLVTGFAIYARQRLADAKDERDRREKQGE